MFFNPKFTRNACVTCGFVYGLSIVPHGSWCATAITTAMVCQPALPHPQDLPAHAPTGDHPQERGIVLSSTSPTMGSTVPHKVQWEDRVARDEIGRLRIV